MMKSKKMEIEDRLLFLKYALPCAGTLVKRGIVSQEHVDNLIELVSKGKLPEDNAENIFKVANAMCSVIAMRMGKKKVDSEVIRRYFLREHDKVVEERFEQMRDFNPDDCKTHSGSVVGVRGGFATVETSLGRKGYRDDFVKDLKEGDKVVVHYGFIVEKLSERMIKELMRPE